MSFCRCTIAWYTDKDGIIKLTKHKEDCMSKKNSITKNAEDIAKRLTNKHDLNVFQCMYLVEAITEREKELGKKLNMFFNALVATQEPTNEEVAKDSHKKLWDLYEAMDD